ncbi:histidine phosphatase family protein [Paenibacillus sp. R14(2021)]|uniref:histidine phosphatase family protein n=1 Tax=Paenibacillus sp. R14(2021) TaxID=2859228 RepID=UPI001C6119A2|nr:histidine phosphatase family protein [Paenibacillus sp. R14(2021)]
MIYVVRHGETDLNKQGRLQGRQGIELNTRGIEQAEALRMQLSSITFSHIYSSPQVRAIQTAEIITGKRAAIDPRLDVFDLGEADRLRRDEVKWKGLVPDPEIYKGVEDINGFVIRVFDFMKELESNSGARDVHILIAGHRCTTGCIGAYFEGMPDNGNILKFSSNNGEYKSYTCKPIEEV